MTCNFLTECQQCVYLHVSDSWKINGFSSHSTWHWRVSFNADDCLNDWKQVECSHIHLWHFDWRSHLFITEPLTRAHQSLTCVAAPASSIKQKFQLCRTPTGRDTPGERLGSKYWFSLNQSVFAILAFLPWNGHWINIPPAPPLPASRHVTYVVQFVTLLR